MFVDQNWRVSQAVNDFALPLCTFLINFGSSEKVDFPKFTGNLSMSALASPRRMSGVAIFHTVLVLLACLSVLVWNESHNAEKNWILVGVLGMLASMALMRIWEMGIVFLVLFSIMPAAGLLSTYLYAPLSGDEIAKLTLSDCMRKHLEIAIRMERPINRQRVSESRDTCNFFARTESAAEDQLKGLANSKK